MKRFKDQALSADYADGRRQNQGRLEPKHMHPADDNNRDPETYAIIGASREVHRVLGSGFLEAVYQEALERELLTRRIPVRREVELPIEYKGARLAALYKADFVCYNEVIVELKALDRLSGKEKAQVINYLKASGHVRGLLLNFGAARLECERLVFSERRQFTDSAVDDKI